MARSDASDAPRVLLAHEACDAVLAMALVGLGCLKPEKAKAAPEKAKSPPRPWLTLAGALLTLAGWLMWAFLHYPCPAEWAWMHPEPVEWLRVLCLLSYLWLLKAVLTKV